MFSSGCNRGILALASGGSTLAAAVQLLFAAGEQGVWYDYSDFSTLFQDSAGTTPVTAVGQPVGKVLDKSGRGNHATQATATSRPLLQQDASGYYYLSFDGVDDSLATAAINFTGTQQATVFAGVTKNSDAAAGEIACLFNGGNTGTFALLAPGGTASATYAVQMSATAANTGRASTFTAPTSNVLTGSYDLSQVAQANQLALRVNAVVQSLALTGVAVTPQAGFVNQPLGIGFAVGGTNFFNGRLYSLIIRGAASSAAQIANAERYVGSKMGIQL